MQVGNDNSKCYMSEMPQKPLTYVQFGVFLGLLAATLAALFFVQKLKSTPAIIQIRHVSSPVFSPRNQRVWRFSFVLKDRDRVTVGIVDANNNEIRRLASNVPAHRYSLLRYRWDGRTNTGKVASDGVYHARIALAHRKTSMTVWQTIELRAQTHEHAMRPCSTDSESSTAACQAIG